MKDESFQGLVDGMNDVLAFDQGERKRFKVHTAQDINAIRKKAKMS